MTEDKAEKALRKVIINLMPKEYRGAPIDKEAILSIDISDKIDQSKNYVLYNIYVEQQGMEPYALDYIPSGDYKEFRFAVEDILDATIINNKQRAAAQKMLDNAFFNGPKYNGVI